MLLPGERDQQRCCYSVTLSSCSRMYHTHYTRFKHLQADTDDIAMRDKHDVLSTTCSPGGCAPPKPRLHQATGDAGYLAEAEAFYDRSRSTEKFMNPNPDRFSYENVLPALHLLLYKVSLN